MSIYMISREIIVAVARAWIGTPYHHQASLRGAGCDCLGLVRGVWRDVYQSEPEAPPPYTPDIGEIGDIEHLLNAARRHMIEVPLSAASVSDMLIFRLRPGIVAKHAAIVSAQGLMIHAQSGDAVREVPLTTSWRKRAVAAFGFPRVEAS